MEVHKKPMGFEEVSLHSHTNDCWVIVNAKVYNVTNFLAEHPGGDEVLLASAGKDASQEFEDAGHGSAARLMLDEFYIAEMDPASTMPEKELGDQIVFPKQSENGEAHSPSILFTKHLRSLVAIAVLVSAIGIRFYAS